MSVNLIDSLLVPGAIEFRLQPILSVTNDGPLLHSVECLARGPRGTNVEKPDVLFEYVRRKHQEPAIDRICVQRGLETAAGLQGQPGISVNVHASTLSRDPGFPEFILEVASVLGIGGTRIIVEITEHAPAWDTPRFLESIGELRSHGVHIALDDIGLGQSNYKMILDARPDFFKIDRYLVAGCARDPHRRAIVESIHQLATRFEARTVAEGVDSMDDLDALLEIGVHLMQGFLFSKPVKPASFDPSLWLDKGRRSGR